MESLPSLHLRFYFQFWTKHWIIAGFGIQACCSSFSLLWGYRQVQPKVGKSKFLFLQLLCLCISTKISGSRAERREVPVLLLVTFLAVMFLLAIAALLCFCGIRAQHERNSKPGIIHHPGPGAQPPRGSGTNELWTSPTEREQPAWTLEQPSFYERYLEQNLPSNVC